jgi:hypothetical protein
MQWQNLKREISVLLNNKNNFINFIQKFNKKNTFYKRFEKHFKNERKVSFQSIYAE